MAPDPAPGPGEVFGHDPVAGRQQREKEAQHHHDPERGGEHLQELRPGEALGDHHAGQGREQHRDAAPECDLRIDGPCDGDEGQGQQQHQHGRPQQGDANADRTHRDHAEHDQVDREEVVADRGRDRGVHRIGAGPGNRQDPALAEHQDHADRHPEHEPVGQFAGLAADICLGPRWRCHSVDGGGHAALTNRRESNPLWARSVPA